ncbi:MAG: hypothetical protein QM791_15555 [Ferruginibacter sp.]
MKHSAKISLAVFTVVFLTLSLGAYKKQEKVPEKSTCKSKICSTEKEKIKNNSGGAYYNGSFLLDNIISEN